MQSANLCHQIASKAEDADVGSLKFGAIRSLKGGIGLPRGKSLGRGPMTVHSEHPGYEADSLVERLARVAIVMSGIAVIVLWLYLLW
jgi:hypothetical protein